MLCARRKETHHQRLAFLRFVASGFARVNGKILMPLFQFLAVKLLSYLTFWLYFPREARYGRVHSSDCHIEVDVPGQNVPRGTCGLQNAHRGVCCSPRLRCYCRIRRCPLLLHWKSGSRGPGCHCLRLECRQKQPPRTPYSRELWHYFRPQKCPPV